jgi:UDP-2-acetamido-3-amino-2,3-dideoxy-glucuronate N-acetyltransferase
MVVLPEIIDERGRLIFAEVNRHIPFEVRRIFSIYEVAPGQKRAGHAHRTNHQFITMLSGACTIVFDDGKEAQTEHLASPKQGLYVPPLIWITLKDFTPGAVCLVLASELYDAAEYIRDHAEFLRLSRNALR